MGGTRQSVIVIACMLSLSLSIAVQANGLLSCEDLDAIGTGVVFTTDFEDITAVPGNVGAVDLVGDEFYGYLLTPSTGSDGLFVGIPDSGLGSSNCVTFFAADFVAVSGDAVFSPENCGSDSAPDGEIIINFDEPVAAFGLTFLDAEGAVSSATAYDGIDGTGSVVGISAIAQNAGDNSQAFRYVDSGGPETIASAIIQLGGSGDGVGMDDFCFVDPDTDGDGVPNSADLCPSTVADSPTRRLGTNRWIWDGADWITNAKGVDKDFTIEETQGCSCEQILDVMVDKTDLEFDGHYKFGCSQSVVEDWISGFYYMETVNVQANDPVAVYSNMILKLLENYRLKAYGVADALDSDGFHIPFDAKYSVTTQAPYYEDPNNPGDWTDLVTHYESEGPELLDLFVNSSNIDWGGFNPDHVYWFGLPGTGDPLSLLIYDIYYPNNAGLLSVDIFVELW